MFQVGLLCLCVLVLGPLIVVNGRLKGWLLELTTLRDATEIVSSIESVINKL